MEGNFALTSDSVDCGIPCVKYQFEFSVLPEKTSIENSEFVRLQIASTLVALKTLLMKNEAKIKANKLHLFQMGTRCLKYNSVFIV